MNPIQKKRLRAIIISAVAVVFAASLFIGLKIEPGEEYENPAVSDTSSGAVSDDSGISGDIPDAETSGTSHNTVSRDETQSSKPTDSAVSQTASPAVKPDKTESTASEIKNSQAASSHSQSSQEANNSSRPQKKEAYCTIEIRCDTVTDTSKLTNKAVIPYIPANGIILPETKVKLAEGETAFEVLKRITRKHKIQFEFRDSNVYTGGVYVEGINHLYEMDAGGGSGWMYKVNGWFPNYGCGGYKMKDGDKMVWCYTCNIGKDVGDQYYDEHPDANPEYQ